MDLTTILLALAFIVFPIIQEILKSRKRPPPPGGEVTNPDGTDFDQPYVEAGRPPQGARPAGPAADAEEARESWSDDWGSWPGAGESAPLPEPASDYQPLQAQPAPEAVVDDAPGRLEELAASLDRLARIEASPQPSAPIRIAPAIVAHRVVAPSRRRELLRINSSSELRRAIVLTEILGPPRSRQPLDSDR